MTYITHSMKKTFCFFCVLAMLMAGTIPTRAVSVTVDLGDGGTSLKDELTAIGLTPSDVDSLTIKGCLSNSDISYLSYYLYNLEYVNLQNATSFTTVPGSFLSGKSTLVEVVLPESVESIGYYAFSGCSKLEKINFPSALRSIGASSFYGCHFKELNIPATLTSIDGNAFWDNTALESVMLPETMTMLGGSAFRGCTSLTSVTLPKTIETFEGAFYGCTALQSIVIPEGYTTIPQACFYGCTSLTSVDIPSSVTSIGNGAFYNCTSLSAISLPSTLTTIESDAFYNTAISALTIPASLTTIGSNAFAGTKLTSVTLPETVTEIGGSAFYNCKSLSHVDLPANMTAIPYSLFYNCTALTSITLPSGITNIGDNAFEYSGITELTIPSGVKTIGFAAFYGCVFEQLTLPAEMDMIDKEAFYGCSKLKQIDLPEKLGTLGYGAFINCTALQEVILPKNLTEIPELCFSGCTALKSVIMPDSVTTLGKNCFESCALTEVPNLSYVTEIPDYAFYYNSYMKKVVIPEGITTIGKMAFYGISSAQEITLPSTLLSMGENAFYRYTYLQSIKAACTVPPVITSSSFGGSRSQTTLTVPSLSVDAYKNSSNWSGFNVVTDGSCPDNIYVPAPFVLQTDLVTGLYKPNVYVISSKETAATLSFTNSGGVMAIGNLEMSSFDIANNVFYAYNSSKDEQRSVCLSDGTSILQADKVSMSFNFNTSLPGWRRICLPFNARISDITLSDDVIVAFCRYDGAQRAAGLSGWVYMDDSEILEAGRGYIFDTGGLDSYHMNASVTINALDDSHKNDIFRADDVNVSLTTNYGGGDSEAYDTNWNLVGNPYTAYYDCSYADTDLPITVYRYDYSWGLSHYFSYRPYDGDELILQPNETFFIQAPKEKSFSLAAAGRNTTNAPVASSAKRMAKAQRRVMASARRILNLSISAAAGAEMDRTRIVLNPVASTLYEVCTDVAKMLTDDCNIAQCYTLAADNDKEKYSINERPLDEGTVRLGAIFANDGDYSLALASQLNAEGVTIAVEDLESGITTDLTAEGATYTFFAAKGESNDRFLLHISSANDVSGISTVTTGRSDAADAIYDLTGRKLTAAPAAHGVYIKSGKKYINR